jgi:hypothetical protein
VPVRGLQPIAYHSRDLERTEMSKNGGNALVNDSMATEGNHAVIKMTERKITEKHKVFKNNAT